MKLIKMDANVVMIRNEEVRMIRGRIPAEVRKALNVAVKKGELGHLKKDGRKPEAYFHPDFRQQAIEQREEHELNSLKALARILV